MPKSNVDDPASEMPDLSDDSTYRTAADLGETAVEDPQRGDAPRGGRPAALKIALGVGIVLALGAALLGYRGHHRRDVLTSGLSKADALLRLDTDAGYRQAASLLEPLAQMDPVEAASVRAFALAMRFADYREPVEADAEALLVAPGRVEAVPPYAHLATAALAMGRREEGNAATAAARAGDGPWAKTLQARISLVAGNVSGSLEPASAASASGSFAPGLAVHGDVLRRLGKDLRGARAAYEAALSASPTHPRAAYGLAKLALAGRAPAEEAKQALQRILDDRDATPAPERGRAALHLAALELRAGDAARARAALDAAALDAPARSWADRAAAAAAANRGRYRTVSGAPDGLRSASDDDPPELSASPPARIAKAAKPARKPAAAKKATAHRPSSAKKATAKAGTKKPAAKKKAAAGRR